jgi:hypothetical protein
MNLTMDRQIAETVAVCDFVRGRNVLRKNWAVF